MPWVTRRFDVGETLPLGWDPFAYDERTGSVLGKMWVSGEEPSVPKPGNAQADQPSQSVGTKLSDSTTWEDLYAIGGATTGKRCPSEHPTIPACRCMLAAGHSGGLMGYDGIYHRYTSGADGRSVSWLTDQDLLNPVPLG